MFALRSSPDAGEKRKRPVADSEPPRRPTSPSTRLSPPTGHRSVQALAKRQSMPFLEWAGWEETPLSSGHVNKTSAKIGHFQGRRLAPLKSASEPRDTHLPVKQPREEHSGTQTHFGRASNEKPPIRLSTEDTIVASPVVRRSNDGKTRRAQAYGAVKKLAKDALQKEGCAVVSQIPRSPVAGTSAEPQLESQATKLSQNAAQDIAHSSPALPQSAHTASPRTSAEGQQADKAKRPSPKTTWDAVNDAYSFLKDAFPTRPTTDNLAFLASLPAAEGALDISPAPKTYEGRVWARVFTLPETRTWKYQHLRAALVQSHGMISESPCTYCATGKGLWKICVRAPTLPGKSQDVLSGACTNCYYNGRGTKCECKSGVISQQGAAPSTPLFTSDDSPLEMMPSDDLSLEEPSDKHRGTAGQNASSAPQTEDETSQCDPGQSVPTNGKSTQDSKHRLQDQAFRFACRVRTLPLEQRHTVTERIESLLGADSFELDALYMARCVRDLPEEERAQSSEMILQILRAMLV